MYGTHGGIVQPDAARWVTSKGNWTVVDGVGGDGHVRRVPLGETEGAQTSDLAEAHRHGAESTAR